MQCIYIYIIYIICNILYIILYYILYYILYNILFYIISGKFKGVCTPPGVRRGHIHYCPPGHGHHRIKHRTGGWQPQGCNTGGGGRGQWIWKLIPPFNKQRPVLKNAMFYWFLTYICKFIYINIYLYRYYI